MEVWEGLIEQEALLQVNAEKAEKDVSEGKGDHTMFHGKAEVDYQGESGPLLFAALPSCLDPALTTGSASPAWNCKYLLSS